MYIHINHRKSSNKQKNVHGGVAAY